MSRLNALQGLAALSLYVGSLLAPSPAAASAVRFYCGKSGATPATLAQTSTGQTVSVIRWVSNSFSDAGWSPERRCQEVSSRFETFRREGRLRFLTTGRMNGASVICTAQANPGPCDGLLYTLKPGQDPTTTLRSLLAVRVNSRGPLNETSDRLYIDVQELLNTAAAVENPPTAASTTTKTPEGLW